MRSAKGYLRRGARAGREALILRVPLILGVAALVLAAPLAILGAPRAAPDAEAPASTAALAGAWYEPALQAGSGHNHRDRNQHLGLSTSNFQLLGWDPLQIGATDRNMGENLCGEIAQRADGRRLAVVNAWWYDYVDLVLVDVTDAAHPFRVGEFSFPGTTTYDSAITRDGRYAAVSLSEPVAQTSFLPAAPAREARYTSACTGATTRLDFPASLVEGAGLLLIDVQDPAAPRLVDYAPMAGANIHSVSSAEIDGRQYLVGSVVNYAHGASYYGFYEVVETPVGARLVPLSTFAPPSAGAPDLKPQLYLLNGHTDATIARHPGTGQALAYLADWDGGMIILDVTIPQAPVMLSQWTPNADVVGASTTQLLLSLGCFAGSVHGVEPEPALRDGRHYVYAGQECPIKHMGDTGGSVFVLDDTDPMHPALVGEWHLPMDTGEWTIEYQASPHYTKLVGTTLFVSMYHAGLWAVDASDVRAPVAIGAYVPDRVPARWAQPGDGMPAPLVLDVNAYDDGTLVAYDARNGVFALRFDETSPMAPAAPFVRVG